jgi:hypothetical protein
VRCHEVLGNESTWSVRPLEVPEHWLPGARFDHRRHNQTPCNECHQATLSKTGRDVLIPGIEVCKARHASERRAGKVSTGCQSYHRWHDTLNSHPSLRHTERTQALVC